MLIRLKFELEGNERKVLENLGILSKAPEEGVFKKPLTAEEASEELGKAAEAVEDKAVASEDKPKKAKATKSTPKEEKPAPETPEEEPEVKEDALREAFYAAMKAGKKAEVKAILAEYGVGRVSEIPKDKRAEAIKKAEALM